MKRVTSDEFIKRSSIRHSNKYIYLSEFTGIWNPITVLCPEHGDFVQIANDHMKGSGCRKCGVVKAHSRMFKSNEKFVLEARNVHGDKFDYSSVVYLGSKVRVSIICKIHGEFKQHPASHLFGRGCKKCNSSKGERVIRRWLEGENIAFQEQKKFPDCRHVLRLSFDFYIPSRNLLIEFDGEQHFRISNRFKHKWINNEEKLKLVKLRDQIKNNYCQAHNIPLLRIKYSEDAVKKLTKYFYGSIQKAA